VREVGNVDSASKGRLLDLALVVVVARRRFPRKRKRTKVMKWRERVDLGHLPAVLLGKSVGEKSKESCPAKLVRFVDQGRLIVPPSLFLFIFARKRRS
jgi:hypothetical protein